MIDRETGEWACEAPDLGNIGSAHSAIGNACLAADHDQQALTISREIGNRHLECVALGNLGKTYGFLDILERPGTF